MQFPGLGINERRKGEVEEAGRNLKFLLATFRLLGFPGQEFAEMYPVKEARRVLTPNAGDPSYIRSTPLPGEPVVDLVRGATHGRGADLLIDAYTLAREEVPELTLRAPPSGRLRKGYLVARMRVSQAIVEKYPREQRLEEAVRAELLWDLRSRRAAVRQPASALVISGWCSFDGSICGARIRAPQ